MTTPSTIRHRVAAVALLALCSAPAAHAQFGGVSKFKDKVQHKLEPQAPAEATGGVQAKVTLEWMVETTSSERVPRRGKAECVQCAAEVYNDDYKVTSVATRTSHGTVSAVLSTSAEALPGGALARQASSMGATYAMLFQTGSGSSDLVSMSGSAGRALRIVESGARCTLFDFSKTLDGGNALSNPGRLAATGQVALGAKNTQVALQFRGDSLVSASVTVSSPIGLSGRSSDFACGGRRPAQWRGVFTVDSDYSEPALPGPGGFALTAESAEAAGCAFKRSKSGNVTTLNGRCERTDGNGRTVTTSTLTFDAPPGRGGDMKVADAPKLQGGAGSVTFSQNGRQATWPLSRRVNLSGPVTGVSLLYTPDGGQPSEERGVLGLTVMSIMGQTMVGLNLAKGPAGDVEFENDNCTAQSTTAGGTMQGSGECKRGKDAVKFTFTVVK